MSIQLQEIKRGQLLPSSAQIDPETANAMANLNELNTQAIHHFGANAAEPVTNAATQLGTVINEIKTKADAGKPFDFDDSLVIGYGDAIFALSKAIYGLLGQQPEIIAAEMSISTELVSPQISAWSDSFLQQLQTVEGEIQKLDPTNPPQGTLAQLQGEMSVLNAESSASSTGLNGVLSMLTSGTSSKTSTYQSLITQAQSVVTALLNAMTQNWS